MCMPRSLVRHPLTVPFDRGMLILLLYCPSDWYAGPHAEGRLGGPRRIHPMYRLRRPRHLSWVPVGKQCNATDKTKHEAT